VAARISSDSNLIQHGWKCGIKYTKAIIIALETFLTERKHIMRKARFKKQLTIAIPLEHFELIREITDEQEVSLAEWIRDAVAAALPTNQPKEDDM